MNESADNNRDELIVNVRARFLNRFGQAPKWIAAAPGRVNLIGEHVDYNDGLVLPLAIDRYTWVAAAPADKSDPDSSTTKVFSVQKNETVSIDASSLNQRTDNRSAKGCWINYVVGVMAEFVQLGHQVPSLQFLIHSTVPTGSGLSSSAALEVATATLLESAVGAKLDGGQKALLCQRAEHEYAGVPCGIMDQFVSVHAEPDKLMMLDCRDQSFRIE